MLFQIYMCSGLLELCTFKMLLQSRGEDNSICQSIKFNQLWFGLYHLQCYSMYIIADGWNKENSSYSSFSWIHKYHPHYWQCYPPSPFTYIVTIICTLYMYRYLLHFLNFYSIRILFLNFQYKLFLATISQALVQN